jgi:hypothetical protein
MDLIVKEQKLGRRFQEKRQVVKDQRKNTDKTYLRTPAS